MDSLLADWIACPRCGGKLGDANDGVQCQACTTTYGQRNGVLDLVDAAQRVSSEGPGDTLPMAWRRRRWDALRGPAAPENAAYLAAIWERLRPDDTVLDLACGPASFLGWMAEFAPELAILGVDLSWPALEEAGRVVGALPNVRLARASTRRRLPIDEGSCDVVLRRLAPALPEEVARVLAPGGHYLRFTFGPNHWREVYDLVPGLPRAREETIVSEQDRLGQLGLKVGEPIRETGSEEVTLPAVMLALRSNPAAFHSERLDLTPIRQLWHREDGGRNQVARLTTEYVILVARRPAPIAVAPVEQPKSKKARVRKAAAEPEPSAPSHETAPPTEGVSTTDEPVAETSPPARGRKRKVDKPSEPIATEADTPKRARARKVASLSDASAEPDNVVPKRRRAPRTASEP